MAKKLVAKTNIKGSDGVYVEEGDVVDASKFTREDLKSLYDNGAIEVADTAALEELSEKAKAQKDAESWEVPESEAGPDTKAPVVVNSMPGTTEPAKTAPAKVAPTKATP